ncbi:transcription factor TFIIIB component B'' homolog isoform X3 [Leucoraja erinacea]|uniref:transcription factor TFIIIB component B'' homolog isoform X3 n=1 Tax=Leucoraja erinaceus TaxID=7782 RepID=UPI0024577A0C|nr:transcription factor TFIIIB component B'' homolog isoform X3 [Leucoraja erinacea]
MFRRSRLSVRPNVKPGGRSSSQALKGDDKTRTSDQQLNSEGKSSNEKDDSGLPAASESFSPTPLPNPGVAQEERDDPDEQQENVPLNKNEKNDKTGVCATQGKSPVPPLQRRKRFSTMLNLAKPRATSLSAQQSANLTAKSPQQQNLLAPVTNVSSIQDSSAPSTTEKALPKSPEKRKPSSGQHIKLPEKKTPIPQVPQFSPVKNHVHKDSAVGTSSPRVPVTRKTLSSPLKERITPSSTPTKGIVTSPSVSPARPKSAKVPDDLERLRKARKLREMLKEEMKKEKKAHKEMIPFWETNHPPERTKMTMRDFIYYLPDTNPMLSSFEEEKRPSFPVLNKEPEVGSANAPANEDEDEDEDEESDDAVLGPRVKVAEDGSIIIDEESLTVEVLRMKKSNIVEENDPIFERGSQTTYSSFRKSTHTKSWSDKETDMFFLAISMVGTDFSMIGQLFPNRSRIEIKNKFKREEKLNSWRIDKAFKEKKPLDLGFFGELLSRVLEAEAKRKRERNGGDKSQAPRKSTNKRSRKSKILKESESDPDDPDSVEDTDHELAEDESNGIAEGTEASCSLEGAQNGDSISKAYSIKHKRKRKMKDAAEQSEEEIVTEQPEKDDDIEKSECKVHQHNKGDREDSVSVSIIEDEDEDNNVTNGETLSDLETSESKQSSHVRRKEKPKEEDNLLSGCEEETLSGTTTPVTRGNSNKSQLARRQKAKPNLKLIGRKKAGGKQDITTDEKPSASYDNGLESGAVEEKESGQDEEKESRPIEEKEFQPIKEEESGSIKEMESASVKEMKSRRVEEREPGRIVEKDSRPIEEKGFEPIEEKGFEPIEEKGFEPIKEKGFGPIEEKESEVIEEKETGPFEEKGSGAVEDMEFGPVEEMASGAIEGKESPPIEMGSGPVEERESGPVVKKDFRPVEEKKSGVIEEKESGPFEVKGSEAVEGKESQPIEGKLYGAVKEIESWPVEGKESLAVEEKGPGPVEAMATGSVEGKEYGAVEEKVSGVIEEKETRHFEAMGSAAVEEKGSPLQDHDTGLEEPSEIKNVSSALMSETTEADKAEEITSSKVQDSDTEPWAVEKREEPRNKPCRPVRSRFQKPKPNLGRAMVKKNVSMQEKKVAAAPENNSAIQDVVGLSPDTSINKASEAHQHSASNACFVMGARNLDDIPTQQDAVQNRSGGTNASAVSSSLISPDAASSDSAAEPSRRSTWDSNKLLQPERTSEYHEQNEEEEITLAAIQENIMSKPTRSGRQPKPTSFYTPSAHYQPPAISTLLSEGEKEGKVRSRPVRSHKAKPKVSKVLGKKEAQTKNTGKGQGTPKMTLVTLRASQEADDDEESDIEEEDDIYPINPEEVNKAPAFVPISLRSPEPVQAQVEETMEEEVIEVPRDDPIQEEDHRMAELGDGLRDAAYTDVNCVDQKTSEEESVLGSDVLSLQIVTSGTHSVNDESSIDSSRPCAPPDEDLMSELDLQKPPLPEEDSTKVLSSSSVTEVSDGAERNIARRRCRFPKPKPNLGKSTSRSHVIKPYHTTENEEMKSSAGSALEGEKQGNKAELKPDDSLPILLVTIEGSEENVTIKQIPAGQPNSKILVPDDQDRCMGEEGVSKTWHLDSETKHLDERLQILTSHGQDNCAGEEQKMNRSEHLESGSEHSNEQLNLSDEQDGVGEKERLNRTEHTESGSEHLTEKLSLLLFEKKDKHVTDDEQMSKTEHLGNKVHDPSEELQASDEQDECVGDEVEMNPTEHRNDVSGQPCERLSPADIQQYTTIRSQDVQPGISTETYFTQSTLTLCQAADPILSVEATETIPEAQCSSYSPKIGNKESQNVEYQETLKTRKENFENLLTDENTKEETIILTLFEIPASSLTEYGESLAPYIPVSENTLSYVEPCPPLTTENIKFTVSPDLSVEAPTVSSMPESVSILDSNVQQWSSNMLSLNMGQMNRKRKADNLSDDQNDSVTKSPEITSSYEDPNENVPQTEKIIQSHLANFSSPKVCPEPSATNTLSGDDITQMGVPPQSADDFSSAPLEEVLNLAHVERSAQTPSEPEEVRKSSQIRRGKLAVEPNISTRRAASTSETDLSDINYNTLNISDATKNAPSLLPPEESVQTDARCNASVDVDSMQQELGADDDYKCENEAQDAAETATATAAVLACYSPEISTAVIDEGILTGQSDTITQSTGSTSSTTLKRPVRKPRGFLSFISKKSSEGESEVKSKRTKFQKPCINLPQFSGKRPIPTAADSEEMKPSGSPPAKRQSCEKEDGSQPNTTSPPTKVTGNSSLQSWQSESYTEEACCAAEQDTEQMPPTRVAEYFFSDIFTEVEEQE